MKRTGYLYERIYDIENVKRAIKNASRKKKKRRYVRRIANNADYYAAKISEMLKNGTYVPSPNKTKVIYDTSSRKERSITIPKFYPDQIIQWATMQVLEPVFRRGMYEFSCGSVPGRGSLCAKKYVERKLRRRDARYILKLDIRKFFPSISADKLKFLLRRRIKDARVLSLLDQIIDAGAPGLPIGYYSSQWLSNFYLWEIDHYIKEELGIRYYVRNVDDMVWIGPNRRKLKRAVHSLIEKLRADGYEVCIKDSWQIWKRGERAFDFVGYRYTDGKGTFVTKRNFMKLMRTVRAIRKGGLNIGRARRLVSYLGMTAKVYFREQYLTFVRPAVTHRAATDYISRHERYISYLRRMSTQSINARRACA